MLLYLILILIYLELIKTSTIVTLALVLLTAYSRFYL
jgi:hypothetical protein